jgi:hypothetical protein
MNSHRITREEANEDRAATALGVSVIRGAPAPFSFSSQGKIISLHD